MRGYSDVAALDQRQAYISQQLARLRHAGLVEDRRNGLNVYYTLSKPEIDELLNVVIDLACDQARSEVGAGIFEAIRPDHHATCPCPKCQDEVAEADLALEEKR
jgi:ArsR family transcriptional regulator